MQGYSWELNKLTDIQFMEWFQDRQRKNEHISIAAWERYKNIDICPTCLKAKRLAALKECRACALES